MWFAGTGGRYYLLLCDGMGTGIGAAEEARTAGNMLRRLLSAGYPAAYALRSVNSLCTLRGRAGAVTLDLAEICLESGKVSLYKWGAAPSWLLFGGNVERIGQAGPPPGISVSDAREQVDRFTLRRGETLILLSDGVDSQIILRNAAQWSGDSPGAMAAKILENGHGGGSDDATAAVLRLIPIAPPT
jgi:stage II sporulation protein E